MNTATARKSDASPASASITEGLANLAEAFQSRKVKVARITLKKDGQTYEHKLSDQPGIHRDIEGQFTDIEIVVSCLSPLNPELNAELQAITTTAATAAEHWTAPLTRPTLVEPHSTSPKMIGESPAMSELHAAIRRAARSVHVTLIIGESGTGKTTAASMIHEQSSRAGKPFVDINCAAFPETLIESELFGYEKGAFTGANATKKGLFEAADGGTLFLDEIGEMKLELQAKLLKAIEQQKIRRVGGTKDVQCDVRIIAASSRNLQDMVTEGKFREDLFYRLAVLEVPIAPLRDRREDIPGLIKDRLTYEQHLVSLPSPFTIEDEAVMELSLYEWPGNIRQLHNVLSRLASRVEDDQPITATAARAELARFKSSSGIPVTSDPNTGIVLPAECRFLLPGESMRDFTRRTKRHLIDAVKASTGNMTHAAKRLKYDRSELYVLYASLTKETDADTQESAIAA